MRVKHHVVTGHRLFDIQTSFLQRGELLSPTQNSKIIHSKYYLADLKGEGMIRKFDISFFENLPQKIVEFLESNEDTNVYLYEFSHTMYSGKKKVHGYIITDTAHNIIETYITLHNKSINIMHTIIERLFDENLKGKLWFNDR